MGIVAWIVLGLIAGEIAKAIMPGKDPGGVIVTILIGIVGAFLGGFLGNLVTGTGLNGFSLWSIVLAVLGALLLLWIYRMTTRGRAGHFFWIERRVFLQPLIPFAGTLPL